MKPSSSTVVLLAVLALALLGGCGGSRRLVGQWELEGFVDAPTAPPIPPAGRTRPSVTFEEANASGEGVVVGLGGVNRFTGTYRASAEQLAVSSFSTTRMAGPPQLLALERAYIGVFQGGPLAWEIKGETLTLTGPESGMTLVRAKPAVTTPEPASAAPAPK